MVEYDELDMRVLRSLLSDARKSVLEISRQLDENSRTVLNRLRRLEKDKIIVGYGANIVLPEIGYTYYKLNMILEKNVSYSKLLSFAEKLPNTIYVDETLGKYDFELNVEVQDERELDAIIDQIKRLTGGLRNLEIFRTARYHKLTYLARTPRKD